MWKSCKWKINVCKSSESKRKCNSFSVDELTYYMVDNKKGEDYSELCRRATNYFEAKSVEIAINGGTVIIDMGMWTKVQRIEIREFFKKNNINFEIHYVKVDDDTWMKNIEKRNKRIVMIKELVYKKVSPLVTLFALFRLINIFTIFV